MAQIISIGTDAVSVARIQAALAAPHGERLLERVFTPAEVAYARGHRGTAESLAARFAAKEACFKAVGAGWPKRGIRYHDVEVVREPSGKPRIALSGSLAALARGQGVQRVHLSLTHTAELALAFVVLEGQGEADEAWR